jgi:hypothetical protein
MATVNPVTCEAPAQLTLSAPGLPPDVAALVTRVEGDRAVAQRINLGMFETRSVMVQGGMFGEHQFTTVTYARRTGRDPTEPNNDARAAPVVADRTVAVNRKFFEVRLSAGMGVTLDVKMKRFANRPGYAFPWHGDRIPVH